MNENSAGNILKDRRIHNGLTIDDVSRGTYIRATYIQAIEEGQYDVISGAVYTRGFIRNYANFLGLDGDDLVRRFNLETADAAPFPIQENLRAASGTSGSDLYGGVRGKESGPKGKKKTVTRLEGLIICAFLAAVILFWIWLFWL